MAIKNFDGQLSGNMEHPNRIDLKPFFNAAINMMLIRDKSPREGQMDTERAAHREMPLLRAALETSADGILVVDADSNIIHYNQSFLALWFNPAIIVETRDYDVLMGVIAEQLEEKEAFLENLRHAETSRLPVFNGTFIRKDGRIIEVHSCGQILDGIMIGRIFNFRDISGNSLAEEKYRTIFNQAVYGISQSTVEGRFITVNPACAAIFGYDSPQQMIAEVQSLADTYVRPEDRLQFIRSIEETGFAENSQVERYRRDGSRIWVEHTGRAVRDIKGNIICVDGFVKDITEQKNLERQLFAAQKMEAIGTLAGGIAHDFNNVLGAIMGYAELALYEKGNVDRRRQIEQIINAADRAKDLIAQILTFSRHNDHVKEPVDLRIIVKEALKLLAATIPATIQIRMNITRERCVVQADFTQMHQILMNICTNAVQAMGEKGGVLEVQLDRVRMEDSGRLTAQGLAPGPCVRLRVSDTGPGINPDFIDRIFDPFFTTKKEKKGTGLGLSVVYGIVKNHSGAVDVASKPAEKTVFTVHLPCSQERPAVIPRNTEEVPKGNGRILFIDDESTLVSMGQRMLSSLGYIVTGMHESTKAWELFSADPDQFDLVITDMMMPQMTGFELAVKILDSKPCLPVILCTGYSEFVSREDALAMGIKAFVMKPYSKRELGSIVKAVLT